jgi:hypothetical protein
MKSVAYKLYALAVIAFLATTPAKAATYDFRFDGGSFDVVARITTDINDIVTDITGTMTGPGSTVTNITNIVATSSSYYGVYWLWNNIFISSAPHVDWFGILWQNDDGSLTNFYLDGGQFVLSTANPVTGDFSNWLNVDPGPATITLIPVPPSVLFLGSGLLGLLFLGRRRRSF